MSDSSGAPLRAPASSQTSSSDADAANELQFYAFGGLKGLRRHRHFKEVRVADPFSLTMLHFPTPLHADNWLVSSFGRSLSCTVPMEPLQALHRGRHLSVRCALIVPTEHRILADFVCKQLDERTRGAWEDFQIVVRAHGMEPVLRTLGEIRTDPRRLQNLDHLRQTLLQGMLQDSIQPATDAVLGHLAKAKSSTLGVLLLQLLQQPRLSRPALECAVIDLYRLGAVGMNLSEAAYGEQTRIQLL